MGPDSKAETPQNRFTKTAEGRWVYNGDLRSVELPQDTAAEPEKVYSIKFTQRGFGGDEDVIIRNIGHLESVFRYDGKLKGELAPPPYYRYNFRTEDPGGGKHLSYFTEDGQHFWLGTNNRENESVTFEEVKEEQGSNSHLKGSLLKSR